MTYSKQIVIGARSTDGANFYSDLYFKGLSEALVRAAAKELPALRERLKSRYLCENSGPVADVRLVLHALMRAAEWSGLSDDRIAILLPVSEADLLDSQEGGGTCSP